MDKLTVLCSFQSHTLVINPLILVIIKVDNVLDGVRKPYYAVIRECYALIFDSR